MAISKRYQLLKGMSLLTYFNVNGKKVRVTFSRGVKAPYLIRGRFATTDPELQKAIEARADFNKQFSLEQQEEVDDPKLVEKVENVEQPPEVPAEDLKDPNKDDIPDIEGNATDVPPEGPSETGQDNPPEPLDPNAVTDYPEITSVTQAKQKLIELFDDVKISTLKNRNDVLTKAIEKKVSFSNLK